MDGLKRLQCYKLLLKNRPGSTSLHHRVRLMSKTHYDVLGVEKNCSSKDIREAYMLLSKKLHPDVSPGSHAEFVLLNEAYQTLSRRRSRALYDASLARPAAPGGAHWRRHGDVETTAPHDPIFWDETIWEMRDKGEDSKYKHKPYYGIKGLNRLSNGPIAVFCLIFMTLGVIIHVCAIRSSHQMAMTYVDEKNRKIFAQYSDAKSKAIDPKDKEKIASFLETLKAESAD